MLRDMNELVNFKLRALDGDIGKVKEFYFEDLHWTAWYLLAGTESWLTGRQALISPYMLNFENESGHVIPVDLTLKQIEQSPSMDHGQPVFAQNDIQDDMYYRHPDCGYGPYPFGFTPYFGFAPYKLGDLETWNEPLHPGKAWNPNLQSTNNVTGHHIQSQDGEVGPIVNFIFDDVTWSLRYLVVNTKTDRRGKNILISPQWVDHACWEESKVFVNLPGEIITQSQGYKPEYLNRTYEADLYRHYNRKAYWDETAIHIA